MLKIRDVDDWGSGHYYAGRDEGKRRHNGVDIVRDIYEPVRALSPGRVTKVGYPYNPDDPNRGHLRYVQVTDVNGLDVRYFYVQQCVDVGDLIEKGDILGTCANLSLIWPQMTNHYHFEVIKMINNKKVFSNPLHYLEAYNHACS